MVHRVIATFVIQIRKYTTGSGCTKAGIHFFFNSCGQLVKTLKVWEIGRGMHMFWNPTAEITHLSCFLQVVALKKCPYQQALILFLACKLLCQLAKTSRDMTIIDALLAIVLLYTVRLNWTECTCTLRKCSNYTSRTYLYLQDHSI